MLDLTLLFFPAIKMWQWARPRGSRFFGDVLFGVTSLDSLPWQTHVGSLRLLKSVLDLGRPRNTSLEPTALDVVLHFAILDGVRRPNQAWSVRDPTILVD